MLIVDAHLDLAYNALNFNRNLRLELEELRASEPKGYADGVATVTIPELKKGGIGLVFGTLFTKPATSPIGDGSGKMVYRNSAEANKNAMSQLDYYHRLADEDETLRLVGNLKDLEESLFVVVRFGSNRRFQFRQVETHTFGRICQVGTPMPVLDAAVPQKRRDFVAKLEPTPPLRCGYAKATKPPCERLFRGNCQGIWILFNWIWDWPPELHAMKVGDTGAVHQEIRPRQ